MLLNGSVYLIEDISVQSMFQVIHTMCNDFFVFSVIGSPGQPLGGCMRHFNMIEANMKLRYKFNIKK